MAHLYRIERIKLNIYPSIQCQQGMILITVLLFLLVINLLVMRTMDNAILQSKMASHYQGHICKELL